MEYAFKSEYQKLSLSANGISPWQVMLQRCLVRSSERLETTGPSCSADTNDVVKSSQARCSSAAQAWPQTPPPRSMCESKMQAKATITGIASIVSSYSEVVLRKSPLIAHQIGILALRGPRTVDGGGDLPHLQATAEVVARNQTAGHPTAYFSR